MLNHAIKSNIQDIKEGDSFIVNGYLYTAGSDAHQNLDESDEPWIVYDTDGNSWFEEDLDVVHSDMPTGKDLKHRVMDALVGYVDELDAACSSVKTKEGGESLSAKMRGVLNISRELERQCITDGFDPDRQIALIWSVEDVQSIRPDLDETQAMDVLDRVKAHHDCTIGVTWDTLQLEAYNLFPIQDFEPDMYLLLNYADEDIVLESKDDGQKGIRVRCEETGAIFFQTSDDQHQHHVGHYVQIAQYGDIENPSCISIECEECGEVIYSIEMPTDRVRRMNE